MSDLKTMLETTHLHRVPRIILADDHAMVPEGLRALLDAMQPIHFGWISAFNR